MTEIADAYLTQVLSEQDAYRKARPPAFPRAMRAVARPVGFVTSRLIPVEAIEATIKGADWAASASIRKAAISHDFTDLKACDEAAAEVRRWALGYAVSGGGAAGAFGVLGLAVDIPTTIALGLRTARTTGLCYGFGADTEAERVYILDILQLAGANSAAEKMEAIARLDHDRAETAPEAWGRIVRLTGQAAGTHAAVRRVASVLGVNLTTRKALQLAPVLGAAVGAGTAAAFQNDVARAARFAYRARWLTVNAGIVEGQASGS